MNTEMPPPSWYCQSKENRSINVDKSLSGSGVQISPNPIQAINLIWKIEPTQFDQISQIWSSDQNRMTVLGKCDCFENPGLFMHKTVQIIQPDSVTSDFWLVNLIFQVHFEIKSVRLPTRASHSLSLHNVMVYSPAEFQFLCETHLWGMDTKILGHFTTQYHYMQ